MLDLILSQSIEINAKSEKVWEALTAPEMIKEYLFGAETITDWNVGSDIVFQGEYEGFSYADKGIRMENELYQQLSYSYWSGFSGLEDKPENYSLVTYTLVGNDSKKSTVFTWTQKEYATENGYNHSVNGMER